MQYSEKLTQIPPDLLRASDYSALVEKFIPLDVLAYINGGTGDELTLRRNRDAFDAIRIMPRVLRDFSAASTQCCVLGQALSHPFLLAPVAHQKLVHSDGEIATARAADAMQTGLIASTLSSVTLEDIAANTQALKWFQLYWQPNREDVLCLVRRAEQAGYSALVVTVDVPVIALRYRQQRSGFVHPPQLPAANLQSSQSYSQQVLSKSQSTILHGIMAQALQWRDLEWLRQQTTLPILIKGILHGDDARRARDCGLQGVVVSNHGGRSLDSIPASIEVLKEIRYSAGQDFTVLMDSGIRHGSDIFKALALGADAVLIGRLQVHALAVAGALGVAHMLRLLKEELEVTMALAGCARIDAITPDSVYSKNLSQS